MGLIILPPWVKNDLTHLCIALTTLLVVFELGVPNLQIVQMTPQLSIFDSLFPIWNISLRSVSSEQMIWPFQLLLGHHKITFKRVLQFIFSTYLYIQYIFRDA